MPPTRATAVSAASIELRDTIRETANTTANAVAAPRPTGQDIANKTPNPVAADLPPVKFSQIERLCPSKTASPARHTTQGAQTGISDVADGGVAEDQKQNQRAKMTAAAPFSTSTRS